MWMTGEPANFDRVANIVKRHWPEARPWVAYFKSESKKAKGQFPPARFMGLMGSPDFPISPDDVIDLWLNCRLAHVGGRPGNGRFSRADYERELNTYGEAQFEYMFMTAVHHVGLSFISLVQLVERLLKLCSDEGLQPSFVFDNLTLDGRRRTETGDSLERFTPGVTIDEYDLASRLALMRRQKPYSEISKLIDMLETSMTSCVDLIQRSSDLAAMLEQIGFKTEIVDSLDQLPHPKRFATISDDFTDISRYPWRKGMIALCEDTRLIMEGDAHPILSEQFTLLKTALTGNRPVTSADV